MSDKNDKIKIPDCPDLKKCRSAKDAIVEFGYHQQNVNRIFTDEFNRRRGLASKVKKLEQEHLFVKGFFVIGGAVSGIIYGVIRYGKTIFNGISNFLNSG